MRHLLILTSVICLTLTACGPSKTVNRVAADSTTDLSGRWNDTDARLVAEEMIDDALTKPWLDRFSNNNNEPPTTIVGRVRNETMEHIDTEIFTKELERAFVNSGMVNVVANSDERAQLRDERSDQQSFSDYGSASALAKEMGADYMIIGNISSILDESAGGKMAAIFYTVNLELVDVETNQKVWIGNKKIKKVIERSKLRG